jgi:two-component system sensor histidine kinase RegB
MNADAGEPLGETSETTSMARLLEAALAPLTPAERARITIEAAGDAQVRGPRRALAQALRGLIKPALAAAPPRAPVVLALALAADRVKLEIRDRGPGIDPEVLARIGEPFFTTKEPGHGMGLGVFLARAVLERSGGTLSIASSPDGTQVTVALTRHDDATNGRIAGAVGDYETVMAEPS